MRPGKYGYRYLLVLVDTFSGWVDAFPTKGETATVVAKRISEEAVPRHGLPVTMGSDNGPFFMSQIVQGLAQALGTKWKLHCPQSLSQPLYNLAHKGKSVIGAHSHWKPVPRHYLL